MLTQNQEKYLQKIPGSARVKIKPFDPKTHEVARQIIQEVKKLHQI